LIRVDELLRLTLTKYYKKVGATYRNPHYPGVRLCMFSWLSRWWQMEKEYLTSTENEPKTLLFDMACGRWDKVLILQIACMSLTFMQR